MSLDAYQRLQVAMLLDGETCRRIAEGDFGVPGADLTEVERRRLASQAVDPGFRLSRKLHKGWRLTKLLTLLPLTFKVGAPDFLGDLVEAFWRRNRPQGLYFEAEARRFAGFVAERAPRGTLLHDAASLEAALLAAGQRGAARPGGAIRLRLARDPRLLLASPSGAAAASVEVGAFDVTVTATAEGPRLSVVAGAMVAGRAALSSGG